MEKETFKDLKGKPEEHKWDRLSDMWFEDYNEWNKFVIESFTKPEWATYYKYPLVKPEESYRSCFLLERPEYDWLKSYHCFL